jgi:hypothetical protein
MDPDPAIFVIDLQYANKKQIFFVIDLQDASKKQIFKHNFFCLLLFVGTFTLFFKDKKVKKSHKIVVIKVF